MKIIITVEVSSPLDEMIVEDALRAIKRAGERVPRDITWSSRTVRGRGKGQDEYEYITGS